MFKKFFRTSVFFFCVILGADVITMPVYSCDCDAGNCVECCVICACDEPYAEYAYVQRSVQKSQWVEPTMETRQLLRTETYLEPTGTYVGSQPVSVEKTREFWSEPKVLKEGYWKKWATKEDHDWRLALYGWCYVPWRLIQTGLAAGATGRVWTGEEDTAANLCIAGAVFSGLNTALTLCTGSCREKDRGVRTARWMVDLAETAMLITAASILKSQNPHDDNESMTLVSQSLITTSATLSVLNLCRTILYGCCLREKLT